MTPPDWNLITSQNTNPSTLQDHLVSADFSDIADAGKLRLVIFKFQQFLRSSSPAFTCPECPKKFKSLNHLSQHKLRRHALTPVTQTAAESSAGLAALILESRDFLANEIRAAVRSALDAQAAVPVGVSFAGDLEISGLSQSPSPGN